LGGGLSKDVLSKKKKRAGPLGGGRGEQTNLELEGQIRKTKNKNHAP